MATLLYGSNKGVKEVIYHSIARELSLNAIIARLEEIYGKPKLSDKCDSYKIKHTNVVSTRHLNKAIIEYVIYKNGLVYMKQKGDFSIACGNSGLLDYIALINNDLEKNWQAYSTWLWADLCLSYQAYIYEKYFIHASQHDIIISGLLPVRSASLSLIVRQELNELSANVTPPNDIMLETASYVKQVYGFLPIFSCTKYGISSRIVGANECDLASLDEAALKIKSYARRNIRRS